jgi:beta-lactamase class A
MASGSSLQELLTPIVAESPEGATVAVSARHLDTGETASFAEDLVFPSASTIKIAIMAALARAVSDGILDLDQRVPVKLTDRTPGSGVVAHMEEDLTLTLRDHAYLMISISDNTTSNILINTVGLEAVQAICREFATGGTMLNRLFYGRGARGQEVENTVTAQGLATLLENIVTGRIVGDDLTVWMKETLGKQQHRDRLARSLYYDESVWYGGKTGSIRSLVHDCGVFTGTRGTVSVAALAKDLGDDPYRANIWMGKIGKVIADYVR